MTQIKATLIDHMGSDLSVVNAARVSFGKKSDWVYSGVDTNGPHEKALSLKDKKLIHYLAKHKHLSPFGHAFASFHVKAPIFVARQLVKHKFLRWNEISRRYVDDEPEFYVPDVWRGRSDDKKQGSEGVVELGFFSDEGGRFEGYFGESTLSEAEWEHRKSSLNLYDGLIGAGVAPEQARMILPQSLMTEWYWSGSLDAFAAMCKLRCASDTQNESRIVANQISELMGTLFPVSWNTLMKGQPMTKAPDRIITSVCGKQIVQDGMKRFKTDIEWMPVDNALALVAAAYEDAAQSVSEIHTTGRLHGPKSTITAIRARTDNDAQAALERRDARIRSEALREVDELAGCVRALLSIAKEYGENSTVHELTREALAAYNEKRGERE